MEQETLYTASKWEILKLLEKGPLSPIELASLTRTSVANISQQLRLLEMAGIVSSERVPNKDKGQPRQLYKIANNQCYIITTTNDFVSKKKFSLNPSKEVIMKLWFYSNDNALTNALTKAFLAMDSLLDKLEALAIKNNTFYLFIKKEDKTKIKIPSKKKFNDYEFNYKLVILDHNFDSFLNKNNDLFILFDPKKILRVVEK